MDGRSIIRPTFITDEGNIEEPMKAVLRQLQRKLPVADDADIDEITDPVFNKVHMLNW